MTRRAGIIISYPSSADGVLRVQALTSSGCVMSTGEDLLIRWDKLRALVEQVAQERAAVWIRTWMSRDGPELIELHRVGGPATAPTTDDPWRRSDAPF